jgi:hypothetical protein
MLLELSMFIIWKELRQLLLLLRKNKALPYYRLEAVNLKDGYSSHGYSLTTSFVIVSMICDYDYKFLKFEHEFVRRNNFPRSRSGCNTYACFLVASFQN